MSIELDKTRNDYTQDEVTEAVRERIQRRIRLKEEIDALSAYIFEAQDEDSDDLSSLKAALVEAEADLETATAQAQAARGGFDVAFKAVETAQPDLAEERANLAVKLATVDEEIREFLLRQEFAGRKASFALTLNGLQVTRTRTNKTKVSYDATPHPAEVPGAPGLQARRRPARRVHHQRRHRRPHALRQDGLGRREGGAARRPDRVVRQDPVGGHRSGEGGVRCLIPA